MVRVLILCGRKSRTSTYEVIVNKVHGQGKCNLNGILFILRWKTAGEFSLGRAARIFASAASCAPARLPRYYGSIS